MNCELTFAHGSERVEILLMWNNDYLERPDPENHSVCLCLESLFVYFHVIVLQLMRFVFGVPYLREGTG